MTIVVINIYYIIILIVIIIIIARVVVEDAKSELTIGRRVVVNRGIALPFHGIADDATPESSTKYYAIKRPGGGLILCSGGNRPLFWVDNIRN